MRRLNLWNAKPPVRLITQDNDAPETLITATHGSDAMEDGTPGDKATNGSVSHGAEQSGVEDEDEDEEDADEEEEIEPGKPAVAIAQSDEDDDEDEENEDDEEQPVSSDKVSGFLKTISCSPGSDLLLGCVCTGDATYPTKATLRRPPRWKWRHV